MTEPQNAYEICQLAENLDQFDFIPKVQTPEEYGRYVIQKSGRFLFDGQLHIARFGPKVMEIGRDSVWVMWSERCCAMPNTRDTGKCPSTSPSRPRNTIKLLKFFRRRMWATLIKISRLPFGQYSFMRSGTRPFLFWSSKPTVLRWIPLL